MFCHVCGTQNDEGSRFCRSCGAPQLVAAPLSLEKPVQPSVEGAVEGDATAFKVCPSCGTEFPPSLKFCDRDGAALVARDASLIEVEASTDPAPAAPVMAPRPEPDPEPEAEPEFEDAPLVTAPSTAADNAASAGVQYCENCGAALSPEDVFCSECGSRNQPVDAGVETTALPLNPDPPAAIEEPEAPAQPSVVVEPDPGPITDDLTSVAVPALAPRDVPQSEEGDARAPEVTVAVDDAPHSDTVAPVAPGPDFIESVSDSDPGAEITAPEAKRGGKMVWVLTGLVLTGAVAGAAFVWRDQLTGLTGGSSDSAVASPTDNANPDIPRVAGTYTAFLMDQEIEISFEGKPAVLAEAKGTARYLNTVNGGRCVSRLVAIESGGIGGEPSGKVLFSQQPVDNEPPCGKDIPMLIDIDKQAKGEGGLVGRIAIEWQSPETKEVLMSGDLVRADGSQ
jgi:uncharacterized OB-fold protein